MKSPQEGPLGTPPETSAEARRWALADEIFDQALDLPAAERPAHVAAACGDDRELSRLVERLLADVETADLLLTGAAMRGAIWREPAGPADESMGPPSALGLTFDRYRITRLLGRGGMAMVYLAERTDDAMARPVALKLIHRRISSSDMNRRFERESRILASLEHPSIARLYDSGLAPDERPYFVMEYVDGVPIDRFADAGRLGIEARLRLWFEAARAVESAHLERVVHRDLKPSNILVNAEGRLKLLDFGVAKCLDGVSTDMPTPTAAHLITPGYASPEQVRGEPVGPASDIYQLGMLLYQLLSGSWPYALRRPGDIGEMLGVIRSSPPRPLAAALRDPVPIPGESEAPANEEIAAARGLAVEELATVLEGEIDGVVSRALAKEATNRPSTVGELIAEFDLQSPGDPSGATPHHFPTPVAGPGSGIIDVPSSVLHYSLLERIGGGGMGQVFRAVDTRLRRAVALKFLAPELQRDAYARERFLLEARAASSLDHPNICPILEIAETPVGDLFIAMVHYEGETLDRRIARGSLEVETAADFARQIAAGLGAAHRRGILHRDVKPANIFITEEGQVKLLDFGLAKVSDEAGLTQSGHFLGTPVYMAPEQVAGQPVPASDLWSLGVVLYEMLSGRRPFGGTGPAALYNILHVEPRPITERRPDTPPWLAAALERLLNKEPDQRYASAAELLADLGTGSKETESVADSAASWPAETAPGKSHPRRRGPFLLAAVLASLALLAVILTGRVPRRAADRVTSVESSTGRGAAFRTAEELAQPELIAVLPFSYRGAPESAYLAEGMVDLLSAKLGGTSGLSSVDPRAILSHLARQPEELGDPRRAVALAARFEARQVLLGGIVEVGGRIHLDASLYAVPETSVTDADAAPLTPIETAHAEGEAENVFALVDELAGRLLAARLEVGDDELVELTSVTTRRFSALEAYLEGESAFRAGRIAEAAEHLESAVTLDPAFALAWYRLSLVREWQFDTDAARRAAEQAATHADRLLGRPRLLIEALRAATHDAANDAEGLYREVLERYPDSVEGWIGLGELLFHCGPLNGSSFAESRSAWEEVRDLEPRNLMAALHLARIAYLRKEWPLLSELTERLIARVGEDEVELLLYRAAVSPAAEDRLQEVLRETSATSVRWLMSTGLPYASERADLTRISDRLLLLLEPARGVREQAFGHRSLAQLDAARGRLAAAHRRLRTAGELWAPYRAELEPLIATLPFRPVDEARLTATRGELATAPRPEAWGSIEEGLLPHARLGDHLRTYQLGLLSAELGDTAEAERQAARLERLGAGSGIACLGGDLARGVRAAVAHRSGDPVEVLAILENRQCECSYQMALASPLVSRVRERYLLAEALRELGRFDEALGLYASLAEGGIFDVVYLAPAHRRQAEIYRLRGEEDLAREHEERFAELWADGDEELVRAVDG